MIAHIDNEHIRIGIDDGILFFTYKNGIVIDLPTAITSVTHLLLVQNGKQFPVLCDISGVGRINRSARIYLSREGTVLVDSLALVVSSKLSTTMAKFYLDAYVHSVRQEFSTMKMPPCGS